MMITIQLPGGTISRVKAPVSGSTSPLMGATEAEGRRQVGAVEMTGIARGAAEDMIRQEAARQALARIAPRRREPAWPITKPEWWWFKPAADAPVWEIVLLLAPTAPGEPVGEIWRAGIDRSFGDREQTAALLKGAEWGGQLLEAAHLIV
jgi:hypothetical protein